MGFSNNQTRVVYALDGEKVTDINRVFGYMKEKDLTNVDSLNLVDQTTDSAIQETPDDDEFVGISSLAAYLALGTVADASQTSDVSTSSGVTAGETRESEPFTP